MPNLVSTREHLTKGMWLLHASAFAWVFIVSGVVVFQGSQNDTLGSLEVRQPMKHAQTIRLEPADTYCEKEDFPNAIFHYEIASAKISRKRDMC